MKYLTPIIALILIAMGCQDDSTSTAVLSETDRLIERALEHELDTDYTPPPGDALSHHASGFAKVLCSGVFVTGLDAEFVAENIGYFSAPYEERKKFAGWSINDEGKYAEVRLPDGRVRRAVLTEGNGCVCLTEGEDKLFYDSKKIASALPEATTAWPMGDVLSEAAMAPEVDMDLVEKAVDLAFASEEGMTAALVVTHRGRIIGERYRDGITKHTPLESWSMGKSLTATLMGVLLNRGIYTLDQAAPIPEWQEIPDDPRQKIRISDILRMSSGLRFRAPQDPDFDPVMGYPDHLYVYTGGVNSFSFAAQLPQQWEPNTIGRYRNCDPVLTNYLIRLGVEGQGEDYHSFPQRALFDKIGVRNMVIETDPYGNFLLQGYEFAPARDWARLGNLYLQDGVWNGERILAPGFVDFVSSLAPAWKADGRDIYGGFFWINGEGDFPIPKDAYFMAGAGGQLTFMIPSHDLVVVKMSHYKGSSASAEDLKRAFEVLMTAIPKSVPPQ